MRTFSKISQDFDSLFSVRDVINMKIQGNNRYNNETNEMDVKKKTDHKMIRITNNKSQHVIFIQTN